ncbi:DNA-binding protein [Clostridium perfringens]|uniref:DNA-binding protein n=1 Tax=Clostridium perfringens TaxID=1502 RepID=UPI0039ED6935
MINISEKMKEHNELVKKRTLSIKEWAEVEGISYNQALKFTHIKDFPIIKLGRERRIVVSKLDKWFEEHIGTEVI